MADFWRKYGEEATIEFALFEVDGVDFRVDAAHAAGDTVIMKDEGAEASTTNGFTDEGTGYSLVLTATEMEAARIVIYIADLTATKVWLDKAIIIDTFGNASAQHAFDLDTALGTAADLADAVVAEVLTEPTNLADKSLGAMIYHAFSRMYHKVTQTATTQIVYKDDETTALGTMTVSDDSTTQIKGEASEN